MMKLLNTFYFLILGMIATQAVADQKQIERGQKVYEHWCESCHGASRHAPGTMALHFKYEGALPAVLAMRDGMSKELLTHFIRNGVSVMPTFRPTEISDSEIEDIAVYLQSIPKPKGGE